MKFRIDAQVYTALVCPGPLARDGRPRGAAVHGRELLISGEVAPLDRLAVLVEQLCLIWEGNAGVPMPRTAFAAFFVNIHRQLLAQGGEPNLMRLDGQGVIDHGGQPEHGAEPVGCECGRCGSKFSVGDITTAGPELDARTGRMVVRRSVFCEHCNDTMSWTERATPAGTPSGHVTAGPFFAREQAGRQGLQLAET